MPEHFHLIISRPEVGDTGKVLQVLKQRVSHAARTILGPSLSQKTGGAPSDLLASNPSELDILDPTLSQRRRKDVAPTCLFGTRPKEAWQFWQRRFYDFNVWNWAKLIEKLKYMHRNPVVRGLVARPEDWPWSSFRHYAMGEMGPVEIESEWTALRRERKVRVM